ncbi:hypothetical protein Mucpa_0302 [Mucilaginibacter paludis DSM 18603]|uniref:Uncharacterized protein n=1 Tax=Mucilaginibacter paludis DSM 18603 TaxID=714943 RepID=H1YGE6_9SPHI|nr:hypothetical protein Mucpa_0302 [Mucilaginibacter paludis DSM 18603]
MANAADKSTGEFIQQKKSLRTWHFSVYVKM